MRREGVVCCIQAQDGHCSPGELFVRTRIAVIVYTGFVTELQSREALVELADCPRLEEERGMELKTWSKDRTAVERTEEPSRRVRTFRT